MVRVCMIVGSPGALTKEFPRKIGFACLFVCYVQVFQFDMIPSHNKFSLIVRE